MNNSVNFTKKLGFIGAGNMATAMMSGVTSGGIFPASDILMSDVSAERLHFISENYAVGTTSDNTEVAVNCGTIILAVKPQYYSQVIAEIAPFVTEEQLIITIAPGQTLASLAERFGKDTLKIIRTMPNTPAMVGAGITAVTPNANVTAEELEYVRKILGGFGISEVIGENLMDAVVSVSGSSPAYVFMFIEAMADAAVADGMPRAQAYRFAAQAVMGSAKMVLETGKHPAELKDMVCSPAGTTIEAVRVLEEKGMRSAVMEAMMACTERSRSLGK
ncbi:MAG: pyrroline-5-carboxylate reductase [Clostridia bacterium]|nr:pyrroline-5-carboxylate reductase [Clostridia bacterium]